MFRQPALVGSAFESLHDELLAYFSLFCAPEDLLTLAHVNSVFYVFSREEPLWMLHCLRLHGGDFTFHQSWRLTTFFPKPELVPKAMSESAPSLAVRNFGSDFLYRRWCRSHMSLKEFVPPSPDNDPYARSVRLFDISEITYQDFFEQFACVPFIIRNAISKWPALTEWSFEKLATRFADAAKHHHRLTHNLDTTSEKDTQMTFANYSRYLQQQHDETPLYIFDPRFGEKMPEMLQDYDVSHLKIFKEDFLKLVATSHDKMPEEKKAKVPKAIRPDFRWTVMGPERSGAPWHTDPARTSAWNALVRGRKRWAIYPPGSPPPGISVGKNGNGRETALNMTSLYWYLHVYPTLLPHQRPYEVIQEEGDVIYVPSGWWHLVLNIDETIAVTQNFVDSHNVVAFVKDLLDDRQDEALQVFQYAIKETDRSEIFDLCRLLQIPRIHGYCNSDMYIASFRNTQTWKSIVKKVLKRHKLNYDQLRQRAPLKNLTARANPTLAIGNELLVKFYSEFNQEWGEFDFSTYLAPPFEDEDGGEPAGKKRKTLIVTPHQLKKRMSLRFAMEECYRIEKSTYDMMAKSEELSALVPKMHFASHLLDVSEVDDEDGDGLMWRWPYMIIDYKHGLTGISKLVRQHGGASKASWKRLAAWINTAFLPAFHGVTIDPNLVGLLGHSKSSWAWYEHYLLSRRKRALAFHLKEDAIPPQLMNLLEQFLPAVDDTAIATEMLPAQGSSFREKPVLLHGDLTDENVLGAESASIQVTKSPKSQQDLIVWLENIGCGKYAQLLVEQEELTFETLKHLTETHLKDLGVPLGPRLSLLKAVESDDRRQEAVDSFSDSDSDSDSDDEGDEVNEYLASPEQLRGLQAARLGKFYGDREWTPMQVIDFADAKTGDPLYDLVAIFFSALHGDFELWREAMETPYWQEYLRQEMTARKLDAASTNRLLRERFLRLTLLHPSRSIKSLFHFFPQTLRVMDWETVAEVVFGDVFTPK